MIMEEGKPRLPDTSETKSSASTRYNGDRKLSRSKRISDPSSQNTLNHPSGGEGDDKNREGPPRWQRTRKVLLLCVTERTWNQERISNL